MRIHVSHVWLTCTVMPSCVAFNQWWRGAPHVQLTCGSRVAHVHSNALTCSIQSMVEGSPSHTAHVSLMYSSRVAHMHGNALTCSIQFNGGGEPLTYSSRVAHVWLTCMVMPSRVAFNQWWRGAPHIQLTCGSCVAHMHGNALMCSIQSMVEGSPSCTAHVQLMYGSRAW